MDFEEIYDFVNEELDYDLDENELRDYIEANYADEITEEEAWEILDHFLDDDWDDEDLSDWDDEEE